MARARPVREHLRELSLAVLLEGQQRLGQLRAVGAGSHDRQEHRAVHVHKGRGLCFRPERCAHQQPDLPFAAAAERQVFSSATDAVHRRGECQHFGRSGGRPVRQPCQRPPVVTTVSRRSSRRRSQVRVRGPPSPRAARAWSAGRRPRNRHPPSNPPRTGTSTTVAVTDSSEIRHVTRFRPRGARTCRVPRSVARSRARARQPARTVRAREGSRHAGCTASPDRTDRSGP